MLSVSIKGKILLESHEGKLEPEPSQYQHQDHVGESKPKPRGKIQDVVVIREQSGNNNNKKDAFHEATSQIISASQKGKVRGGLLVHLAFQNQIWSCPSQSRCPTDACSVAHTERHTLVNQFPCSLFFLSCVVRNVPIAYD